MDIEICVIFARMSTLLYSITSVIYSLVQLILICLISLRVHLKQFVIWWTNPNRRIFGRWHFRRTVHPFTNRGTLFNNRANFVLLIILPSYPDPTIISTMDWFVISDA